MHWLFDRDIVIKWDKYEWNPRPRWGRSSKWHDFALYHSRSLAKLDGVEPSPLCAADKLVPCLMPWWIYVPMAKLTGEIAEYMTEAKKVRTGTHVDDRTELLMRYGNAREWFEGLQRYMASWVASCS